MNEVNDLGCFRRPAAERTRGGNTYYEEEAS
mgnify:FL=1